MLINEELFTERPYHLGGLEDAILNDIVVVPFMSFSALQSTPSVIHLSNASFKCSAGKP